MKALLDWSAVNKYFSTFGWDRFRWGHSEVSCQKIVLNFFCKTHRKTPVRESLFNKFAGLQPKRDSSMEVFLQISLNSKNFIKFLKNRSGWLLLQVQYRLIAIKIQIVFKPNWILKVNSQKSLFFCLLLFSFLFFFFFLYLRKKSYMNMKPFENSGHLRIRERLVRLYRDISKSFFKNYGFLLFS